MIRGLSPSVSVLHPLYATATNSNALSTGVNNVHMEATLARHCQGSDVHRTIKRETFMTVCPLRRVVINHCRHLNEHL